MKKIKIPILVITALASVIGVAELHWLKSQESLEIGKWLFGVCMVPWLVMSLGFLALWYLNLFAHERAPHKVQIIFKIVFAIVTSVVLAIWVTIIGRFVI